MFRNSDFDGPDPFAEVAPPQKLTKSSKDKKKASVNSPKDSTKLSRSHSRSHGKDSRRAIKRSETDSVTRKNRVRSPEIESASHKKSKKKESAKTPDLSRSNRVSASSSSKSARTEQVRRKASRHHHNHHDDVSHTPKLSHVVPSAPIFTRAPQGPLTGLSHSSTSHYTQSPLLGNSLAGCVSEPAISPQSSSPELLETITSFSLSLKKVESDPAPPPRSLHGACCVDGTMVVFGGSGDKVFRDCWKFNVQSQSWQKLEVEGKAPSSRQGFSLTQVDDKAMLLFGGQRRTTKLYSDMYYLQLERDHMDVEQVDLDEHNGPHPLSGHSAVFINKKLVIFGGQEGPSHQTNSLSFFCPRTMSWTFFTSIGVWPSPRNNHCCCVVGGKMYVFGGYWGKKFLNDMWVFDQEAVTWRECKANHAPMARAFAASVSLHDRFIVICGGREYSSILGDIHIFDTYSETWLESKILSGVNLPAVYGHTLMPGASPSDTVLFGGQTSEGEVADTFMISLKLMAKRTPASPSYQGPSCMSCSMQKHLLLSAERKIADLELQLEKQKGSTRSASEEAERLIAAKRAAEEAERQSKRIEELEATVKTLRMKVEASEQQLALREFHVTTSIDIPKVDEEQAQFLPIDHLDRMIELCNENIATITNAKQKAKRRKILHAAEEIQRKEKEIEANLKQMDEDIMNRIPVTTGRPYDFDTQWDQVLPDSHYELQRSYFLIPIINRSDSYMVRTETSVNSGDDNYATEDWLLTRPEKWHTAVNWRETDTILAKRAQAGAIQTVETSGSGNVPALVLFPDAIHTKFVLLCQAIARMNCDILSIWRSGLIAAPRKYPTQRFMMEFQYENHKLNIVFRDQKERKLDWWATLILIHLDEMLEHWSEHFQGYTWLRYCVENYVSDAGEMIEDLIPIQTIHLALSDIKSEAESVISKRLYSITDIAPDLLLPVDLSLDFERDLRIGRQIGKGGFANIFEGIYKKQKVAVKMCNVKSPIISQYDSDSVKAAKELARHRASVRAWRKYWKEIVMLTEVRDAPHTLKLVGYCRKPFCIVTDYLPHGDLYHLLANEYQYKNIPYSSILDIAIQAGRCLQSMHSLSPTMIHMDFKTPNVFLNVLDHKNVVVECSVGDFGCARHCFYPVVSKRRLVANPAWLSPEQVAHSTFTEKVDVYSFGIFLHELISRQHPFAEFAYRNKEKFESDIKSGVRPTISEKWPEAYQMLVQDCWSGNQEERPSFTEILQRLEYAATAAVSTPAQ